MFNTNHILSIPRTALVLCRLNVNITHHAQHAAAISYDALMTLNVDSSHICILLSAQYLFYLPVLVVFVTCYHSGNYNCFVIYGLEH